MNVYKKLEFDFDPIILNSVLGFSISGTLPLKKTLLSTILTLPLYIIGRSFLFITSIIRSELSGKLVTEYSKFILSTNFEFEIV